MGLNRAALERLRLMLGDDEHDEVKRNATLAERVEAEWLQKLDKLFASLIDNTLALTERNGELVFPEDIQEQIEAFLLQHKIAATNAAASTLGPAVKVHAARGKTLDPTAVYQTRGTLADAYTGEETLTHTVVMPSQEPLCNRVKADNLVDEYWGHNNDVPTCPVCRARDPRFANVAIEKKPEQEAAALPKVAAGTKPKRIDTKKDTVTGYYAKKIGADRYVEEYAREGGGRVYVFTVKGVRTFYESGADTGHAIKPMVDTPAHKPPEPSKTKAPEHAKAEAVAHAKGEDAPPVIVSQAKKVKALYIAKVQELFVKNSEDFLEGKAVKKNGERNPDAFDREKARRAIQDAIGASRARARTIVETETTRYYNQARRDFYDEIDTVDGYLFIAVRDAATTKWCAPARGSCFSKARSCW